MVGLVDGAAMLELAPALSGVGTLVQTHAPGRHGRQQLVAQTRLRFGAELYRLDPDRPQRVGQKRRQRLADAGGVNRNARYAPRLTQQRDEGAVLRGVRRTLPGVVP